VAHTSSSTSGSPFRRSSVILDSACWTACLVLFATVRQTSRTASRRAISSLIAGSPARRSACCARNRSASRARACERELSSDVSLLWTSDCNRSNSGLGGRGGGGGKDDEGAATESFS